MVELRAPCRHDAAAIAEALNAASRALGGRAEVSEIEVGTWFELPDLDPEHDCRVAALPDGTVVGYADLAGGSSAEEPLWIDLRRRLEHDDVIAPLLGAMEARAVERSSAGTPLRLVVSERDESFAAFVSSRGYTSIRSSYTMEVDLAAEPQAPEWPAGMRLRAFVPGEDDERVFEANNTAFADHWDFHPQTYEQWRGWNIREPFDPELWFVVERDAAVAGICLCRPWQGDETDIGWVEVLGVAPSCRRRGIGRSLLLHAFRVFRERGRRAVGLGVDAENTTGAVRLYESAGMRVVHRRDIYEKLL